MEWVDEDDAEQARLDFDADEVEEQMGRTVTRGAQRRLSFR